MKCGSGHPFGRKKNRASRGDFGNYGNRSQSDGGEQAGVRFPAPQLRREFRDELSRFEWKEKPRVAGTFGSYGNRLQSDGGEQAGVRFPARRLRREFRDELARSEWKEKPRVAGIFGNYGNRSQSDGGEEAGARPPAPQLRREFREQLSLLEWRENRAERGLSGIMGIAFRVKLNTRTGVACIQGAGATGPERSRRAPSPRRSDPRSGTFPGVLVRATGVSRCGEFRGAVWVGGARAPRLLDLALTHLSMEPKVLILAKEPKGPEPFEWAIGPELRP